MQLAFEEHNARLMSVNPRNGSGRIDVFALVPVGRAVRGAEWKEAK